MEGVATVEILDPTGEDAGTITIGSDRRPVTVIARTARSITVREDRCTPMGGSYERGHGEVDIFTTDEDGEVAVYTLRKTGHYVRRGAHHRGASTLTLGIRRYYRDPHF